MQPVESPEDQVEYTENKEKTLVEILMKKYGFGSWKKDDAFIGNIDSTNWFVLPTPKTEKKTSGHRVFISKNVIITIKYFSYYYIFYEYNFIHTKVCLREAVHQKKFPNSLLWTAAINNF